MKRALIEYSDMFITKKTHVEYTDMAEIIQNVQGADPELSVFASCSCSAEN